MRLYLFPLIPLAALAAAILAPRLNAPVSASPVTPAGDKICYSVFPLNPGTGSPYGIIQGPDGNIWFFESLNAGGYAIARITPAGVITDFPVPGPGIPRRMTAGPDGNLWYTRGWPGAIGRMTLTGTVTTFTLPVSNTAPFGITTGPDGNLWFTEPSTKQILRMTPSGTVTGQFGVSGSPGMIAVGSDNALWFTEEIHFPYTGKIGRISLSGVITEFLLPSSEAYPTDVTLGPDGNIWYTKLVYEIYAGKDGYGKITPNGTITEFDSQSRVGIPYRIVAGADGNLWAINMAGKYRYAVSFTRITLTGYQTEFIASVFYPPPPNWTDSSYLAAGADGKIWATLYLDSSSPRIIAFDPRSVPPPSVSYFPFVAR